MRLDMPIVETKRLLLRPLEEGDACDMYEYYKDVRVMQFLSGVVHKNIDETLYMVNTWELPYKQRGVPQTWVIEHVQHEKVIGNLNFHTVEDDIGEIGYMLHYDYWNQGIMQEAIQELVNIGFTHVGLRRIEAKCAIDNVASLHLLAKCRFKKEGILRQYAKLQDDTYHDMLIMSILKHEYLEEELL